MTNSKFNEDHPHTLYIVNYTIAVCVTPALGAVKHSGTGSEVLEKESEEAFMTWDLPPVGFWKQEELSW